MSKLVIVESPAKAKTIAKYLGKDFKVMASNGHIRDLPTTRLGIDVDNDFEPRYINVRNKSQLIKQLKKAAHGSDAVFLATDPDREGEAISWHLAELLGLDTGLTNRVTFGEITKKGVTTGMENPRSIDMNLFYSQQARRILDRLVGYTISPFLWKKVRRGLSAGRVQSVALKLIVDREREITSFVPKEYWDISALLSTESGAEVTAAYYGKDGKKSQGIHNKEEADLIVSQSGKEFTVSDIKDGVRHRSPAPPFITSTLQQDASRKLGFSPSRTMQLAQTLYEGVDIDGIGAVGLITYMRTDSLRISDEAATATAEFITEKHGDKYLPPKRRIYKNKGGSVQDAHEAIRPSDVSITPEIVEASVSGELAKLYRLIFNRFVASQMADAKFATQSLTITAGEGHTYKASGYTVTFDGFMTLYVESTDEKEQKATALPKMSVSEKMPLKKLNAQQKFTEPPARYNDASIIKALEENGIGRPSTYAPTINTIVSRGYVQREQRRLHPTELGFTVNDLMSDQWSTIVDVKFSADMERLLDDIEQGQASWKEPVKDIYVYLQDTLEKAEKNLEGKSYKIPDEPTDIPCELCGRMMVIRTGRYGKFLGCPGYPECKNIKPIAQPSDGECPVCGKPLAKRKNKMGRTFFGCTGYPECTFLANETPTEDKCPSCNKTLFKKLGKNPQLICHNPSCPTAEKK